MCKQVDADFCSELGRDMTSWSRESPLAKPAWIEESFKVFEEVLRQTSMGNIELSKNILEESKCDDLRLRAWFDIHAQNTGTWRYKALGKLPKQSSQALDTVKSFSSLESGLFVRDSYQCRYCKFNVIPKRVFKKVQYLVGNSLLPLGRTNRTRSGYYLMFAGTLDHVVPWSIGGPTNASNLVTSCWSCNYGKSNYSLEQLGLDSPVNRTAAGDPSWVQLMELLLGTSQSKSQ
jgi:hypothetical protein